MSTKNTAINLLCKAESDIIFNKIKKSKSKVLRLILMRVGFLHIRGIEMRESHASIGETLSKRRQCINRVLQLLWRMGVLVKRYIRIPGAKDTDKARYVCSYKLAPIMLQDYLFNALLNPLRKSFPQANDTLIRLIICLETDFNKFRSFQVSNLSQVSSKSKSWDILLDLPF